MEEYCAIPQLKLRRRSYAVGNVIIKMIWTKWKGTYALLRLQWCLSLLLLASKREFRFGWQHHKLKSITFSSRDNAGEHNEIESFWI